MKKILLLIILISCDKGQENIDRVNSSFYASQNNKTPWTHSNFKDNSNEYSFAIVSDRAGGTRPGVFKKAISKLNNLRPEFVISVGDLIDSQGVSEYDEISVLNKRVEFDNIVNELTVPFFYTPGNHDLKFKEMKEDWDERYGRTYYHFVFKKSLFIVLDSEDSSETASYFSSKQLDWLSEILNNNNDVKWTFVFLHKPVWSSEEWGKVNELIRDREATIFSGHIHRYKKWIIEGKNYYSLATTGGASSLKFEDGKFDHFTWVTMGDGSPIISNIMLGGVFGDDPVNENR